MATMVASWILRIRPMRRGSESDGTPSSESSAAPTGMVTPPESATTPFEPTSTPGVARPCTARSVAMVEKAPPAMTARASWSAAPRNVRSAAAASAASALAPTSQQCAGPLQLTGWPRRAYRIAAGSAAPKIANARGRETFI
jgi:hypothetical protein